jgi:adenylate cyclase
MDGAQQADESIRFRVGMSIGDAIADGTDLHGDAVNVAARLQAECPPGGICVSRSVRDHVHGRLELTFEELGTLSLRNIARPVEAFLLRPNTGASVPMSVECALVQGTGEALPLPDKPSIAVLAFTNMSGDPDQEYFSDGIADDIITELSRSRSLFVIARNSSFTYKGRAVDIRLVARELGVRYVLEGSVRRSGGRVRVVAQLIDAETGNHIWAERFDRALEDVFAVQDEITTAVVTAIVPAVADAELQRLLRKPPESLGAWEAYQRGLWHVSKASVGDHEMARHFFQRAIDLDPMLACGHAALAQSIMMQNVSYGTLPLSEVAKHAIERARVAVEIDPNDADAQAIMAFALWTSGDFREAWQRAEIALANNPNSPQANGIRGALLIFGGRPREGRDAVLATLRLNPHDRRAVHLRSQIAISHYFERDYNSACEAARHAIARHPEHPLAYRWLAASLGQLGRAEGASDALRTALAMSSQTFELQVRSCPPWFRPEDHEHMLDGLRKAGWQG